MFDPGEHIRRLKEPVQVRWTAERTDRVVRGLQRRQRRNVAAPLLVGLVAATFVGLWLWRSAAPIPNQRAVIVQATTRPESEAKKTNPPPLLRLQDGSIARRLAPNTVLQIQRDEPTASVIALHSGRAFFDVVPRAGRLFRVEAGPATVDVLGTAFTVSRNRDTVDVQVERGHVRVLWLGGQQELIAGQQGQFPPQSLLVPPASPPLLSPAVRTEKEPRVNASTHVPRNATPDHGGRLLAQADAAQLSGQRALALVALRRFQSDYASDRRVALAAFTEGRLLMELGQATAAARTFRLLQSRDPQGPLHEDALAREVQAWDQAQDITNARRCAEEYLRLYPSGSRRTLVLKHGHLPPPQ